MNILDAKFPTGQVAEAAEIEGATLQNWIRRGHIRADHGDQLMIEGGGVRGRPRVYSWAAMMEVSIAARLIEVGTAATRAFEVAQLFSDTGDGGLHWEEDGNELPERKPGLPFHYRHGETILTLCGEDAEIILTKDGDLNLTMYRRTDGRARALVALNVSEVFQLVALRLGCDAREILDQAYPVLK